MRTPLMHINVSGAYCFVAPLLAISISLCICITNRRKGMHASEMTASFSRSQQVFQKISKAAIRFSCSLSSFLFFSLIFFSSFFFTSETFYRFRGHRGVQTDLSYRFTRVPRHISMCKRIESQTSPPFRLYITANLLRGRKMIRMDDFVGDKSS